MNYVPPPRSEWSIPEDITYLNHGSFGPSPRVVQECREDWSRRLERQPMDFYLTQMEPALDEAMSVLARFVGADARDMVFVDNATVGMNVVAASLPLQAGDEVLLNDHEYGAVFRIWRQRCQQTGARVVTAKLGLGSIPETTAEIASGQQYGSDPAAAVVKSIFDAVTPRTRLIVVSHVTSPSAIVLPVAEICRKARARGIPVCVDGPHAIAMRDVNLGELDCDYYCASLHKWLCAPFGSGFLYVKRQHQRSLTSPVTSWGRSLGGRPERWQDQLNWLGTRDPAPNLAVPAAIRFMEQAGLEQFRLWTHQLAASARQKMESRWGQTAWIPDSIQWYASMIAIPLKNDGWKKPKPNAMHPLQQRLRERYRIEIPVTNCCDQSFLRVSCHLYNTNDDIDRLIDAVEECQGHEANL
ncbi:aminotransferase class V-fold PLP-dependent enzyme [Schlesneria sp.]|uniref:aminotransferase class V-fold PLP-dependent enzyme n=1 Tax=Schlesneria sp. TaxID=2762018 RepID=UPI002F23DD3D